MNDVFVISTHAYKVTLVHRRDSINYFIIITALPITAFVKSTGFCFIT